MTMMMMTIRITNMMIRNDDNAINNNHNDSIYEKWTQQCHKRPEDLTHSKVFKLTSIGAVSQ